MDYNTYIYILFISILVILIIAVYKLDLSIKGNPWYYYLKYKLESKNTDLIEKEALLNDYLQKVGHGQLYIYKEFLIYSRFCILQKSLLKNEILYNYDPERRPAKAREVTHQHYFVFDCFVDLTDSTYSNVLNIYELVTYFEQEYQKQYKKNLDYTKTKVETEFVCIARNKNDLKNSFFYNITTKLNSYKNRQEFISAMRNLLSRELFKENGILNSYTLENLTLANMFYFDNDLSNITQKDVVEALQLTFKNNKKLN